VSGSAVALAAVVVLLTADAARASGPYVDFVVEGSPSSGLKCSASGRCVLYNGVPVARTRHFTLTRTRLAALKSAFRDAGWRSLHAQYGPFRPAKEPTYYAVTHAGRRVAVSSLALEHGRVPRRLVRVLDVLKAIVAAH
jgi:hypothetical protein